ncbi:hypothetical protein [Obesumbacterium proteus]|uniref:hypothetical protein n=1 Tax=Obesumbacterium proteus TaxID=82983 RepID=UPI0013901D8E|nr:hypothetical protein [Obesumbacterium proteus]
MLTILFLFIIFFSGLAIATTTTKKIINLLYFLGNEQSSLQHKKHKAAIKNERVIYLIGMLQRNSMDSIVFVEYKEATVLKLGSPYKKPTGK